MIANWVLAGLCATTPLFDATDPPCASERTECQCSECLIWDPADLATRYEIHRITISNGTEYQVGVVSLRLTSEDNDMILRTDWCVPFDVPFPHEGVGYTYKVRACNDSGCGGWSNTIYYAGSPYACFDMTHEIQCYTADPLVTR